MLLERLRDFSPSVQPQFLNEVPLDFPPPDFLAPGPMQTLFELSYQIELEIENHLNSMDPPLPIDPLNPFNITSGPEQFFSYADEMMNIHAASPLGLVYSTEEETSMSSISEASEDDIFELSDDDITEISDNEEPPVIVDNMSNNGPSESVSTNASPESMSSSASPESMSSSASPESMSNNGPSESTNSNGPSVIVCNGPSENACAGYVLDPLQIVVYLG